MLICALKTRYLRRTDAQRCLNHQRLPQFKFRILKFCANLVGWLKFQLFSTSADLIRRRRVFDATAKFTMQKCWTQLEFACSPSKLEALTLFRLPIKSIAIRSTTSKSAFRCRLLGNSEEKNSELQILSRWTESDRLGSILLVLITAMSLLLEQMRRTLET